MSVYSDDQKDPESVPQVSLGMVPMLLNWVGAIISVTLIVGLVYWAFQLGSRDPNEVPIIRAMEGPARKTPTEPGGEQARNQGLAVNTVQAEGSADGPSAQVVLAPAPMPLAGEDVAGTDTPPRPRPQVVAAISDAPAAQATGADGIDAASPGPTAATATPSEVITGSAISPRRSPRPFARPAGLKSQLSAVQDTLSPAATSDEVASVAVGTRLVQLGAYNSQEMALSAWKTLVARHNDLLGDKKRLVLSADSGGRTFYRLRAVGFDSQEASRNLCAALLARGTSCIPVTAR
jgi:sporulation related protein